MNTFRVELEAQDAMWTVTSDVVAHDKTEAEGIAISEAMAYPGVTGWTVVSTQQLTD